MDLGSAYVLRLLNHWVLDFEVHGKMREEGAEVWSIPDWRGMEKTYRAGGVKT